MHRCCIETYSVLFLFLSLSSFDIVVEYRYTDILDISSTYDLSIYYRNDITDTRSMNLYGIEPQSVLLFFPFLSPFNIVLDYRYTYIIDIEST